jgi:hypothetical protein
MMGLFGPSLMDLLEAARGAIDGVVSGQLGRALTPPEWSKTIGKKKEDEGLGFTERRAWVPVVKAIVEERLHNHKKYGSRFRVVTVDEKYCDDLQKTSLRIMAMDLATTAMTGVPRTDPLIS